MHDLYLKYFGLKEPAFNITPDPSFLYLSASHREGLAQLSYGIDARKGFIVLTGEVGTGKTTLIQALLGQTDGTTRTAFIFCFIATPLDLLRFVCEEFGLIDSKSSSEGMHDYLVLINEFLLERYRNGDTCALIIDEAQNLSLEVLEAIRLLSNYETAKDKLLQIFLVGQPELANRLNSPALRQLKQRVTLRHHLRPLSVEESRAYISNRMNVAGGSPDVFAPEAIEGIHRYAGGIPRLINVLCDNALLTAFALQNCQVEYDTVKEVAEDLNLPGSSKTRGLPPRQLTQESSAVSTPVISTNRAGNSVPIGSRTPSKEDNDIARPAGPSNGISISVPPKFLQELTALLTDAMGPMAALVLRDQAKSLGETLTEFPQRKVRTLLDAVSQEICDESIKRTFQRVASDRMRTFVTQ